MQKEIIQKKLKVHTQKGFTVQRASLSIKTAKSWARDFQENFEFEDVKTEINDDNDKEQEKNPKSVQS